MPDQMTTIFKQTTGWRRLKAFISLVSVALTGCFGAPAMHYDIQEYNKQIVSSEKQMLLFNIGALHYRQPPHFMMLSSVSQSRTFSGVAGFQWTNPATWQAGPFTATGTESPTITFVPVQGQEFAQRFESPLVDKFSLFYEDLSWSPRRQENAALANLVGLFAESLDLTHGDNLQCKRGLYFNRPREPQDLSEIDGEPQFFLGEFSRCVAEITRELRDTELIDGHHPIPTKASTDPLAADDVTALQQNYEWNKSGDKFALTNPIRIPAWFDYTPNFIGPPDPKPKSDEAPPYFWSDTREPKWQDTGYFLPKGYSFKVYRDHNNQREYALVPDGYDLVRDSTGTLKSIKGHYMLRKLATHLAEGKRENGKTTIADTKGTISIGDVGREITGMGIPSGTKLISVTANTATMSRAAYSNSKEAMRVGDDLQPSYSDFSYSDEVISDLWPAPYDNVYVELRENGPDDVYKAIDDAKAERLCFSKPDKSDQSNLVCGYFKIGDLYQIMKRLAEAACHNAVDCPQSIFGIGIVVPPWADTFASFTDPDGIKEFVWVPAHDPQSEPALAERDRKSFLDLYKVYQMSLVDTSKLVTAAPSITIPK